ncbi:MAG: hypothetical protein ACREHD_17610, partial [Pirellulales bacterium]
AVHFSICGTIGYDTTGISEFVKDRNAADLLDGIFVGTKTPLVTLTGQIMAGGGVDLGVVSAGVEGGLVLNSTLSFVDPNHNGKLHWSDILGITNNWQMPACLFDISGTLDFQFDAYLSIDGAKKDFTIADQNLATFGLTCTPYPVLATPGANGVLKLNMGPNAALRKNGDITDDDETFEVSHVSGTAGDETVRVTYTNSTSGSPYYHNYSGVSQIVADGGAGNNTLTIDPGVLVPVHVGMSDGGPGNNTVTDGGSGPGTFNLTGNNTLTITGASTDTIDLTGTNTVVINGASTNALHVHGTNSVTISGPSANTLRESDGSDSFVIGGGSVNTLNLIGTNSATVIGQSTNTFNVSGTNSITLEAASTNAFDVSGSSSTTVFVVGVKVSALGALTGTSDGVSALSLTGAGSGNTYVVSGLEGFAGVVTLNDAKRNTGQPAPVDTITLAASIGAYVNMYPDGSGGSDIQDGGVLDILGSQPQDSTTISQPTDVEESAWNNGEFMIVLQGTGANANTVSLDFPWGGPTQSASVYYFDTKLLGIRTAIHTTAYLTKGSDAVTFSAPLLDDLTGQVMQFPKYFEYPATPKNGQIALDASALEGTLLVQTPLSSTPTNNVTDEFNPEWTSQWAYFGQNAVTVSAVNPALHVVVNGDNALPANFDLYYPNPY